MKTRRLLLALGIAVALLITGLAATAGLFIWRERSLPVYIMAQEHSPDGARVTETLTLDGVQYIHSLPEFALESLGRGRRIGKTEGDLWVYAPAGQGDNPGYLILTGFMFPDVIYRRADAPAFDPQTLPISELRLAANLGSAAKLQKTQDPALIAEVLACLREPAPPTPLAPERSYFLELLSPRAPGVCYLLYVTVAPDGKVFLAEKASPEDWFAAGENLVQWARAATGQAAR